MWAQAGSWEIHVLPGHEQYFTLVIDRTVRAHLVYRDVI
jgi:hypothetical protein